MSADPIIMDSRRSWLLLELPDRVYDARDYRLALQGHILSCAWSLERLMAGGMDGGEMQRYRVDDETRAARTQLITQLLALVRDCRLHTNRAHVVRAARADETLQRVLAAASEPKRPRARAKRASSRGLLGEARGFTAREQPPRA